MKYFFLCILSLTYGLNESCGQTWSSASSFHFGGVERHSRIGGFDKNGNMYVAVNSTSGSKSPWAAYNLLKIDLRGNKVWSKLINEYYLGRIATDSDGNTFIAAFDFIACFDKQGEKKWEINTKGFRGYGDIFISSAGFYVNGGEKSGDSVRTFIAKYSTNGDLLSIRHDHTDGIIFIDPTGKSYFTKKTGDSTDPVTGNAGRMWIYDTSGFLLQSKFVPHYPDQIIADGNGNTYLKGWFAKAPVEIGGKTYQSNSKSHFMVKYDREGNYLWHKVITGSLGSNDITLDHEGNLYYTTGFSSTISINGDVIGGSENIGHMVIVKYNSEGKELWSLQRLGSAEGRTSPEQVVVDPETGSLGLSGYLGGEAQIGDFMVKSYGSGMYTDLLVCRIDQRNLAGLNETNHFEPSFKVFPNPSNSRVHVSMEFADVLQVCLTLFDVQGKELYRQKRNGDQSTQIQTTIDISSFVPGLYFLEIKHGNSKTVKKIVRN